MLEFCSPSLFSNSEITYKKIIVYLALDGLSLNDLVTSQQNQKEPSIIYFNGFDRVGISKSIRQLNTNEKVLAAIWICSTQRDSLTTKELCHQAEKTWKEIRDIEQRLIMFQEEAIAATQRANKAREEAEEAKNQVKIIREAAKLEVDLVKEKACDEVRVAKKYLESAEQEKKEAHEIIKATREQQREMKNLVEALNKRFDDFLNK